MKPVEDENALASDILDLIDKFEDLIEIWFSLARRTYPDGDEESNFEHCQNQLALVLHDLDEKFLKDEFLQNATFKTIDKTIDFSKLDGEERGKFVFFNILQMVGIKSNLEELYFICFATPTFEYEQTMVKASMKMAFDLICCAFSREHNNTCKSTIH